MNYTRIALGDDEDRRLVIRRTNRRIAVVLGLLAAAFMAYATYVYIGAVADAQDEAEDRLETFNDLRHDAMRAYFITHENEAVVWAENETLQTRAAELFADWDAMTEAERMDVTAHFMGGAQSFDPLPGASPAQEVYLEHYWRIQPEMEDFILHHGFYDLFMFTPAGELAFTVVREADFGLDYSRPDASPYADTGLGRVARQARRLNVRVGEDIPTAVSDFKPYAPSNDDLAAFVAEPIPRVPGGVLAIQLPFDQLNDIMGYGSGLRSTGRTLLVGSDKRIRNVLPGDTMPPDIMLDTRPVEAALAGERYVGRATGDRGQPIIAAGAPLDFHDLRWAIVTEMDVSEVREPLRLYLWIYLAALLVTVATALAMYLILRASASNED